MHTGRQKNTLLRKNHTIKKGENQTIKIIRYNCGVKTLRSFMLLRIIAATDHSEKHPSNGPSASLTLTRSAVTIIGG
jgi:hypothetical protein